MLPFGRFSSAAEAALDAFVACCGEGALEHTIFVFTRCKLSHDDLKAELMRSAPPALRRVIPLLAFPSVLGVDVIAQPVASRTMLRTGIDEAIESLEGQRYSHSALESAIDEYVLMQTSPFTSVSALSPSLTSPYSPCRSQVWGWPG